MTDCWCLGLLGCPTCTRKPRRCWGWRCYWNHKTDFVAALTNANIDFESSSLVLIRSTAGSISIKVTLTEPMLSGNSIVFRVHWDIPGVTEMMMNYNCFAVTVPKGTAANVRIVSEHEKNLLLPLPR